jgi:heptosyltransferase-3
MAAGLPALNEQPKLYLNESDKPLIQFPHRYIVIQVESNEEERNWEINKWIEITNYLVNEIGINVVELGYTSKLGITHDNYINLCGKLSLREIAYVISKSETFIGIDSAFAHLSNALDIKSIILLGKYRIFKSYNPYSGHSDKIKKVRTNKNVKYLETEDVKEIIKEITKSP